MLAGASFALFFAVLFVYDRLSHAQAESSKLCARPETALFRQPMASSHGPIMIGATVREGRSGRRRRHARSLVLHAPRTSTACVLPWSLRCAWSFSA
jgi:hypothetical protein